MASFQKNEAMTLFVKKVSCSDYIVLVFLEKQRLWRQDFMENLSETRALYLNGKGELLKRAILLGLYVIEITSSKRGMKI